MKHPLKKKIPIEKMIDQVYNRQFKLDKLQTVFSLLQTVWVIVVLILLQYLGCTPYAAVSVIMGCMLVLDLKTTFNATKLKKSAIQRWAQPCQNKIVATINDVDQIINVDLPLSALQDDSSVPLVARSVLYAPPDACTIKGKLQKKWGMQYLDTNGLTLKIDKVLASCAENKENDVDTDSLAMTKFASPLRIHTKGKHRSQAINVNYANMITTSTSQTPVSRSNTIHTQNDHISNNITVLLSAFGTNAAIEYQQTEHGIVTEIIDIPQHLTASPLPNHTQSKDIYRVHTYVIYSHDTLTPSFVLEFENRLFVCSSDNPPLPSIILNRQNTEKLPRGLVINKPKETVSNASIKTIVEEQYIIPDEVSDVFEYATSLQSVTLKQGYTLTIAPMNQICKKAGFNAPCIGMISKQPMMGLVSIVNGMWEAGQCVVLGAASITCFAFASVSYFN